MHFPPDRVHIYVMLYFLNYLWLKVLRWWFNIDFLILISDLMTDQSGGLIKHPPTDGSIEARANLVWTDLTYGLLVSKGFKLET